MTLVVSGNPTDPASSAGYPTVAQGTRMTCATCSSITPRSCRSMILIPPSVRWSRWRRSLTCRASAGSMPYWPTAEGTWSSPSASSGAILRRGARWWDRSSTMRERWPGTMTALGEVTVVGVCIPWRDAHVRSGTRDRQPWEDHLAHLAGLSDLLASLSGPDILVGDFNQRISRRYTPEPVHAALLDTLGSRFTVATAGLVGPDGRMAIDHIAHTSGYVGHSVAVLSGVAPDGTRLSDHFGVVAELHRS